MVLFRFLRKISPAAMRMTASAPATAPAIKPVLLLPSLSGLLGCVTSGSMDVVVVDVVVVDEVVFGVGVASVVLVEVGVGSTTIEDVVVGFGFGFGFGGGGGGICGARL